MERLIRVLTVALVVPVAAADWPGFQGPKRDNKSPDAGLLKKWPKGGPSLAWRAKGIGYKPTLFVTAGDRIMEMASRAV